jgi:hypothetical protein
VAACLAETGGAQKLREALDRLVRPRRAEALERYYRQLEGRRFPKGARIEIDPTLEQPGLTVHIHLKRDETIKLDQLKEEMDVLFHELEFL